MLYNLHRTRSRTQIRNTLTCVIIFFENLYDRGDIKVVQVPSEFQHADILTKALAFDLFAFHRKFLMNLK